MSYLSHVCFTEQASRHVKVTFLGLGFGQSGDVNVNTERKEEGTQIVGFDFLSEGPEHMSPDL